MLPTDWTSLGCLLLVVASALAIRLFRLGYDPFWLDEAWSLWLAQRSWIDLWTEVPQFEIHPPLFYSLLKLWTGFGVDEFTLRLLPAIFGTASAGIAYAICRIAVPGKNSLIAAVVAGLFVAAHPLQIHYSQEIREYSMMAFAYAILLAGSVYLAANIGRAGIPWWGIGRSNDLADHGPRVTTAWIAVTVGGALCLWSNNTGAIFVASCGLPLAAIILRAVWRKEIGTWAVYNGLGCAFLVLLLWTPWIPFLIHHVGIMPDDFWIQLESKRILRTLGDFLTFSFPGRRTPGAILKYGILPCSLVVLAIVYLIRRYSPVGILLTTSLVFPLLASLTLSLIVQPIVVSKALLPVALPFAVLIGFGIQSIWDTRRTIAVAAVAALALFAGRGAWQYSTDTKIYEPWRDAAALIADSYQEGDVILALPNFVEFPLRYYLPDSQEVHYPILGVPKPYPEYTLIGFQAYTNIDLEPWFRQSQGIWLVIRNNPNSTRDVATLQRADRLGKRVLETRFGAMITVYYFQRPAPMTIPNPE
ncbi:MAG: hypothetical protein WD647_10705 [Steroidobacteraceae bacterium]